VIRRLKGAISFEGPTRVCTLQEHHTLAPIHPSIWARAINAAGRASFVVVVPPSDGLLLRLRGERENDQSGKWAWQLLKIRRGDPLRAAAAGKNGEEFIVGQQDEEEENARSQGNRRGPFFKTWCNQLSLFFSRPPAHTCVTTTTATTATTTLPTR